MGRKKDAVARYLTRHCEIPDWVRLPPPDKELRIVVVIPAFDELEHIEAVLDSLKENRIDAAAVEVLVCVNNASHSPEAVKAANLATLKLLEEYAGPFPVYAIDRASPGRAFVGKESGVGFARRLVMDVALSRLASVGRSEEGLIACLDGDSPAAPGYLDGIWQEMQAAPAALAGVCRYRHPIPKHEAHARSIVTYESWLRYFEQGLRVAGSPYAFQTLGSCMVLRARGYALADGAPKKQALADFYLLQKVVKAGGAGAVKRLQRPLVRPSARLSTRVPRGTGPSVGAGMQAAEMQAKASRFEFVEPPTIFFQLRQFFAALAPSFERPALLQEAASPFLANLLEEWGGFEAIDGLRRHAPDGVRFEEQFHTWFDSLKIVKAANRARDHFESVFIFDAVDELLGAMGPRGAIDLQERIALLERLRALE